MKHRKGLMAVEAGQVTEIAPSRYDVQLISAGEGSTGIYPPAALEQAAKDRIFPKGTHMYIDHPTTQENIQRKGVRSVRDLAAVLEEDARYDAATESLRAPVKVVGRYRTMIGEIWENIGTSIRAICYGHAGTWNGIKGNIVDEFAKGLSVDFVSKAGRGGQVLAVLEGAEQDEGLADGEAWVFPDGRIVTEADAVLDVAVQLGAVRMPLEEALESERREALSKLIAAAYQTTGADGRVTRWTHVRDYDEDAKLVWFVIDEATWQQSWTTDSFDQPQLVGDRVEVRVVTRYVPIDTEAMTAEHGRNTGMPEIDQKRLDELTKAEADAKAFEQQATAEKARADKAEADLAESRKETRESMIQAKLAGSKLSEEGQKRVREIVDLKGEAADEKFVVDAIASEEAYSASLGGQRAQRRVGFGASDTAPKPHEEAKPVTFTNAFGRTITIGE